MEANNQDRPDNQQSQKDLQQEQRTGKQNYNISYVAMDPKKRFYRHFQDSIASELPGGWAAEWVE